MRHVITIIIVIIITLVIMTQTEVQNIIIAQKNNKAIIKTRIATFIVTTIREIRDRRYRISIKE